MKDGIIAGIVMIFSFVVCGGILIACYAIGAEDGELLGQQRTRQEAIKAGVAYYAADESGKPQFMWRTTNIAATLPQEGK
jgi:hypothetical protein